MRKHIIVSVLLISSCLTSFSQKSIDDHVLQKVDSLKSLLKTAKGTTRVDYLNSIAQGLLWVWESNDNLMHEALKHADEALKLATKLKYKRGIGYATLSLFHRETPKIDTSRIENYKPGSHFQKAVAIANKVIKIGEELQDDILIGTAHNQLKWLYRWKGKREDYADQMEKSIYHFEKALNRNWANIYRPLPLIECANCTGVEFHLGNLYEQQAGLQISFKDETIQKLRKAIFYYEKANALSSVGEVYLALANNLAKYNDIRTAVSQAKNALPFFKKANDPDGEFNVYQALCEYYFELGDLENGLLYSKKAVQLAENLAAKNEKRFDPLNYPGEDEFYKERRLFYAYFWIARFYSLAGDYDNAYIYFKKASNHNFKNRWSVFWGAAIGNMYRLKGNYDSALHYLNTYGSKVSLARLYNDMKQYDKSIEIFEEISHLVAQRNNLSNLGRLHASAAAAYFGKKDYNKALGYARKADAFFRTTNNNLDRIDNYELLSDIYKEVGKFDSAYIYLKRYNGLRDSVLNRQFYIRLNDFKTEVEEEKRTGQIKLLQKDNLIKAQQLQQQILLQQSSAAQLALLNKDYEIKNQLLLLRDQQLQLKDQTLKEQQLLRQQKESQLLLLDKDNKLKDQQLKQQTTLRNALLAGLFLFLLLGVFFFRWLSAKRKNERLKSEKRQSELQQQSAELEMQALRAQMNPHFIFNCLSSINKFILKNESRAASDYLTRFSRLIRTVLTNSQLSKIPLSDEIEMLRLYLEMERLRFDNNFNYDIVFQNNIEPESVYIPPMILQPICENAIWHGLMHKEENGKLDIRLSAKEGWLECVVTDNGVGRKKASELKSKNGDHQKSFGLKITTERLALFNEQKNGSYEVLDLHDEHGNAIGTSVRLLINTRSTKLKKRAELA